MPSFKVIETTSTKYNHVTIKDTSSILKYRAHL